MWTIVREAGDNRMGRLDVFIIMSENDDPSKTRHWLTVAKTADISGRVRKPRRPWIRVWWVSMAETEMNISQYPLAYVKEIWPMNRAQLFAVKACHI